MRGERLRWWLRRHPILFVTLAGLLGGLGAWISGEERIAQAVWGAATVFALIPLTVLVLRALAKRDLGVDLIALLAMAGAVLLGEYFAGAVVALMLSGGQALEGFADERARRELTALLERAPRSALRNEDGKLVERPIEAVVAGDVLLIRAGEVVPVDGVITTSEAMLDESALTGEALPVEHFGGDRVRSGVSNIGGPFELRAVGTAQESTYAGIIRLVAEAQSRKAPFVRMADRYALVFLPATLFMAGFAWAISGDPVRALAVLVVATPCPLILAAPVAIVAGMSKAAGRSVIVKGGGALETLGRATILLFDKTGTLTLGVPRVLRVETDSADEQEVLRYAASLDQVSSHVLAEAVVGAARERGLRLDFPTAVVEEPGLGIKGRVGGRRVAVGKSSMAGELQPWCEVARRKAEDEGATTIFVGVDGIVVGVLIVADELRDDAPDTIRDLRAGGVERILLVTGDHARVAERVGAQLGLDEVLADTSPEAKVQAVTAERERGITVMVGDGINDAPALAAAHVGVAMGARGATATSEAADVVLLVDRLDRLADGIKIARGARAIAVQSIVWGMLLSVGGMFFAAAGLLVPVAGALVQEAIDVGVILNALRVLRIKSGDEDSSARPPVPAPVSEVA